MDHGVHLMNMFDLHLRTTWPAVPAIREEISTATSVTHTP